MRCIKCDERKCNCEERSIRFSRRENAALLAQMQNQEVSAEVDQPRNGKKRRK